MSSQNLNTSLLRPAVLHILRAAGFHSARTTVVDTLTDLCARYLVLIGSKTADLAYDRAVSLTAEGSLINPETVSPLDLQLIPTVTDVRTALASVSFFADSMTSTEEVWAEEIRKPLSAYPPGARDKERRRRADEDTKDVREFVDWATGPTAKEIRRIAGLLTEESLGPTNVPGSLSAVPLPGEAATTKDDYLVALKKKHSKGGDSSRYAGTVIGNSQDEEHTIKIDGGPANMDDWKLALKRKREEEPT